jgi:mycofactocin precursor
VNVPHAQDVDSAAEQDQATALIEDVSIDGMCGVY